jgi:hypothetical protein
VETPSSECHLPDIPEVIPFEWGEIVEFPLEAAEIPDQGEDEEWD